ncbi:hypothetical protein PV08_11257 [Exophiala spinifera]|uniref:AB hydrolase-1 domain-containing protein n=1 Tax=Exophiala spinifera TaxID=91928 RepID=A0A0D2AUV8_9EURO|nr:uncharacterized protein PV08_11257 [Exophiala spinifera]KIW10295.1 hypothetical protein PV08_11257 [Exophiala spinifera]
MTSVSRYCLTRSGTNIHYSCAGSQQGRLALLLHGLGGSTATFQRLLPSIPSDYQIVSVDIEGFGKSALNPETPLSFARYVADLHDLITHLQEHSPTLAIEDAAGNSSSSSSSNSRASDNGNVLLIGHSLGGIISLHYAASYPGKVAGLLLLGVGRSIKGIPPAQQRMRDLAKAAREKGMKVVGEIAIATNLPADRENEVAHLQEVRDAVASCSAEAYAATAEVLASDDHLDPEYGLIKCPAVFVAGDKDVISPPQRSKDISSLLGGPAEVVVVRSGHQMILQDLKGVQIALTRLLAML